MGKQLRLKLFHNSLVSMGGYINLSDSQQSNLSMNPNRSPCKNAVTVNCVVQRDCLGASNSGLNM